MKFAPNPPSTPLSSSDSRRTSMLNCFRMREKNEESSEAWLMWNGSMLVEALFSICHGTCYPIRGFTAEELKRVTNNYGTLFASHASDCSLYKGSLHGRPVLVKKFEGDLVMHEFVVNSVVIASRMSAHRNVLKLIGCCLESKIPLPVHEFAENGSLEYCLRGSNMPNWQPLAWKCRLRIAMDIANVIAYLHTAFSRPMIHRDIRPEVILLDEQNVAKLHSFSLCISIPEGESHVHEVVRGRMGYIAPEYANSGVVTEKVDVFAFGMLLFVLLTGRRWFHGYERLDIDSFILSNCEDPNFGTDRLNEVVDPSILNENFPRKEQQLQEFCTLAFSCAKKNADERPTMMEVGKQLGEFVRSGFH